MAELRVVVGSDPAALLRAAAEGFLTPLVATAADPFPTVPYLLVLRQGGLRDDVIEMAAAAKVTGWFDPPLCIFHELPKWLGAPDRVVLGDYERLVLLERLVRESGRAVFAKLERRAAYTSHIDRLFGELISEGVSAEGFSAALLQRSDRDVFETSRDSDLGDIYADYLARLSALDRADGRDEWIHCARALTAGTARLDEFHGRRELRIFGLQDLRRGWLPLLRALEASGAIDRVTLYTSVELPLGDLGARRERLSDRADSPVRALFGTDRQPERVGTSTLIVAPDADREMDLVAADIRKLVLAGTAPHQIAVVAREARPNLDRALTSLSRFGIPCTARQRFMLGSIPVVRALTSLFEAAAGGWTRAGLVEIAYQPYMGAALDADVINAVGYRQLVSGLDEWEQAFEALEDRARKIERQEIPDARGRPLPTADRVAASREAFTQFAAGVRTLGEERTILQWVAWLSSFVETDPLGMLSRVHSVPADRMDIVRLDLAGWTSVATIVREWHAALAAHGDDERQLGVAQFTAELRGFLTGDVALWTPVYRGVQVLEALSAAYRSFEYVFLVGLESGAFPKAAPSSPIFEDADRDALAAAGIPLERRELWDEREQELFRILVAGATRGLTMSYSRLDGSGSEVIASAFVDKMKGMSRVETRTMSAADVIVPGRTLYRTLDGPARALHAASIESERLDRVHGRYNGRIEAPDLVARLAVEFGDDRLWSPSQLEDFAKCPWAYFSKRLLRIEKLEEPDEDVDAATRGSILHAALKLFYDRARARMNAPVFLESADTDWALALAEQCVAEIVQQYAASNRLGHRSLHAAKLAELTRIVSGFLKWEMWLHDEMVTPNARKKAPYTIQTAVESHEVEFDDMIYESEGIRIRYRGSIDRVEVSVDSRVGGAEYIVATDYKTTKSSTPGMGRPGAWAEGVVLQVPLYAYAISKLRPSSQLARAGYVALAKPETVQELELIRIDKKSMAATSVEKDEELYKGALAAAIGHVKRARSGEFPVGPPGKCTCPPWCHGRDICRIPGGPVPFR